jgi:hypothetical protein
MRVKIAVNLDEEAVAALDHESRGASSRSRLIEQAILDFRARRRPPVSEAGDVARIHRWARKLNQEMADVLDYQVSRAWSGRVRRRSPRTTGVSFGERGDR